MAIKLTGKVFIPRELLIERGKVYQLEAEIDGEMTRLQGEGSVPETCLFHTKHSGLEVVRVLKSMPPQYAIECNCGYKVVMKDVNSGFERNFLAFAE